MTYETNAQRHAARRATLQRYNASDKGHDAQLRYRARQQADLIHRRATKGSKSLIDQIADITRGIVPEE